MTKVAAVALAAVALVSLTSCDEDGDDIVPPTVIGTVSGAVTADRAGLGGVTVILSNGLTATTDASGRFSFRSVPSGAYTVSISGFPADVSFRTTVQAVVIATQGQAVAADFPGQRIAGSTASPETAGNRPPTVGPIRATLRAPATTYTVDATDPDGDTLTYQWRNTSLCGTFRPRDAQAVWQHPHPPCGNETSHPGTITVDVSDGMGNVVRRTYEGSSEGVGPAGSP